MKKIGLSVAMLASLFICCISLFASLLFFNISFPISQFIVNDNFQTMMNCLFISLVLSINFFIVINRTLLWLINKTQKLLLELIHRVYK